MKGNLVACLLGLLFIISCTSDDDLPVSMGDNFISPQTSIALVDTFSVKMSTVLIDSIPTSQNGYLLVGTYEDEESGTVSSSGYFQLGLPESIAVEDDEIFDSLALVLEYSAFSYGDTLSPQTIVVKQVVEDIEEDDEYSFYNTSSFKSSSEPLGQKTFIAKPNFYDELEIRLSDEKGQEFFEKMKDGAEEFSSSTEFLDYFKGLVLEPGPESSAVLAFNADSMVSVVLYSHYIGEEKVEKSYSFLLSSELNYFNHIETDRTGTPFENLATQKVEIPSSETAEKVMVQAGGGVVTRLDFPSIEKLLEFSFSNILYKAEIELQPVPGSDKTVPLPDNLVLYTTDKYNNLLSELVSDDGTSLPADFYYDEFYNENTYYSFDVTDFIFDELSDAYVDPDNGLIISMSTSQFQGSLERLVIDARNDLDFRPVLKLYYVFYE